MHGVCPSAPHRQSHRGPCTRHTHLHTSHTPAHVTHATTHTSSQAPCKHSQSSSRKRQRRASPAREGCSPEKVLVSGCEGRPGLARSDSAWTGTGTPCFLGKVQRGGRGGALEHLHRRAATTPARPARASDAAGHGTLQKLPPPPAAAMPGSSRAVPSFGDTGPGRSGARGRGEGCLAA